ncbi:MAG: threonine synthase [Candidatus Micrarchaeia archaeon]
MDYYLKCTKCGEVYDRHYEGQTCNKCGGLLEVVYKGNLPRIRKISSFWDFKPILPKGNYREFEVGLTKTIEGKEEGLWLKLETDNPTHSFKDRGSVIEVAKAKEYGFDELVCASTGNMAYSLAYYAKAYNIKAKIFVSKNVSRDKMEYIRKTHDADVTKIDGDFTMAQKHAEHYAKAKNVFLAGDYCYRKEGQKTIMYELINHDPDYIFVPIGNATLLSGVLKALNEIKNSHSLRKLPKVVGVEAEKCSPLYKAMKTGKLRYEEPRTAADAIAVGYPTFGMQAIGLLKRFGGYITTVGDAEMEREQELFYEKYGLIAELAGVASIAAYKKIKPKGKSIAIISGGNI